MVPCKKREVHVKLSRSPKPMGKEKDSTFHMDIPQKNKKVNLRLILSSFCRNYNVSPSGSKSKTVTTHKNLSSILKRLRQTNTYFTKNHYRKRVITKFLIHSFLCTTWTLYCTQIIYRTLGT